MEHNFENLAYLLNRCSAKVADQVIAEIRTAINDAANGSQTPVNRLSKMCMSVRKAIEERAAARRAKAAARRAAKKAAKEASKQAEKAATQEVLAVENSGFCGEAEAELPRVATSAKPAPHFSEKMVKSLRQCSSQQMLAVLNSYTHLLITGSLIHTDTDHRFLDNFIYLARLEGLIVTEQEPTIEEASTFLLDNPASPLPRAERRRLQRLARKHKLLAHV